MAFLLDHRTGHTTVTKIGPPRELGGRSSTVTCRSAVHSYRPAPKLGLRPVIVYTPGERSK